MRRNNTGPNYQNKAFFKLKLQNLGPKKKGHKKLKKGPRTKIKNGRKETLKTTAWDAGPKITLFSIGTENRSCKQSIKGKT